MFQLALTTNQPDLQQRALRLYRNVQLAGKLRRAWAKLLGRTNSLRTLSGRQRDNGRYQGIMAVPIAEIVGSEGRAVDFDADFVPLGEHTRDRWVRVAIGRVFGCSLPPVQLIRTADGYYVSDGHHRISVARALGEDFIEAEVVSWA
jgi:hypothetical protein